MSFSSINIQGNIISSETLDKIRSEEKFKHQTPESFDLSRTASLRDEIGLSWSILRTQWQAFKKRLETLPKGDTGTSLTRERFVIPLLQELGYEVNLQKAQQINGKSYAISHGSSNLEYFPLHIMGYNDNLDKRRETGGPRLSPHALVQEYLNNTEHLFALISNGKQLRLLRDATRLVRMSYLEFDLERMFEEELYADFSILYRVLHASRMPQRLEESSDSYIEFYHQESLASGTRIRERLSDAVEESIKRLANGFLEHPQNILLIKKFEQDSLNAKDYYTHQLRLIYRILFLIVLEERKLIYPEELTEEQQRFRNVYYQYYSIERLRKLTENSVFVDAGKYDLWESLKTTFYLFEREEYGSKLGIKPLGSGLFAPQALGNLKELRLNNGVLLDVLKRLTSFVNEQGQLVRVNYSDLDVEEFGSIYEGLLEYDPKVEKAGTQYQFSFVKGEDRSSSGSHYTPEELVKPLIKHSLDYIIEDKLKEANPEAALLSIKVCDVACGSGHILLSAARRIATELASLREGAEQPSPTYFRTALRDVIRNCIYGVDLNPLAVELCKVAMWLEAHNPNEPLNFLDHHIKCGNAIVGLAHAEELEKGIADEAFKSLPEDEKEVASAFKKQNTQERKTSTQLSTYDVEKVDNELQDVQTAFEKFTNLPENTPEEIVHKEKAYQDLTNGKKWFRLKNLADLQVAQFFIPKTTANKDKLTTHAQYITYLKQGAQIFDRGASMAVGAEKRFFHWFLEFPEVFQKGGFDCILGNPPFLGDRRLKVAYGNQFLEWIRSTFTNGATIDLVGYFFLRINEVIKINGFQSLISTNTITQGKAREEGLEKIISQGSQINHAVKSMKWPGLAAVEVSLITIFKGTWNRDLFLNNETVENITPYLDHQESLGNPMPLNENDGKSYQGSIILGMGFVLEKSEAVELTKNSINKEVVLPYLNGSDLNSSPDQSPSRYVINFRDWSESKAKKYAEPYEILKEKVKPERQRWKIDKSGNEIIGQYALRKPLPEKWWQHAEKRPAMYKELSKIDRVLVSCRVSKYVNQSFVDVGPIFDVATSVVVRNKWFEYAALQSSIHDQWAWKYASTMKFDIRYTNRDCIDTFPLPIINVKLLDDLGETYHDLRSNLMMRVQLGLTKTYNQYHNQDLIKQVKSLEAKDFQKKFGKETWHLYNHLEVKKQGDISYEEAVSLILKLRELHKEMDEAVLVAYGWHEDSEKWGKAIQLRHDFYEVEYLPENDRVRYTIHPEARKEVLKRLLLLNHERYAEEIKQGLHKKKDVEAFYKQKGKDIPEDVEFSDKKTKKTKKKENIRTIDLFNQNESIMKEFGLQEGIYTTRDVASIINKPISRVRSWFNKLVEIGYEGMDKSVKEDVDNKKISFHGLIELVVIGELLDNGFTIRRIFDARKDLAKKTNKLFPFATNNVNQKMKVSGSDISWDFIKGNVTLNGKGQYNLEIVREFFRDIEFKNDIAQRIIPSKGNKRIEINPTVAGGKPALLNGRGIQVEQIFRMYSDPESIEDIISDYDGITKEDIEAVLQYKS